MRVLSLPASFRRSVGLPLWLGLPLLAVWGAWLISGQAEPLVQALFAPVVAHCERWAFPLNAILTGRYGFLTMAPLLMVWTLPLVVLFGLVVDVSQRTGIAVRLAQQWHPFAVRLGVSGDDLIRALMGLGCNVPAVASFRGRSARVAVAAIGFGVPCSFQLGAALSVFSAAQRPSLALAYSALLAVSLVAYLRIGYPTPRSVIRSWSLHTTLPQATLDGRYLLRAVWDNLVSFLRMAFPVFFAMTLIAALLDAYGVLEAAGRAVAPLMAAFRLPADAALPIALACVRKDGLILLAEPSAVAGLTNAQMLTAVYLGGVLTPCATTIGAMVRALSPRETLLILAKQVAAACFFALRRPSTWTTCASVCDWTTS
jgi:ferrous iron transport protein B